MEILKRTKIIATIGPSSSSDEKIKRLIEEGVNLFRFNVKHNDHKWHKEHIEKVRSISNDLDEKVGIIVDLQGPDIRIGDLSKEELNLQDLNTVFFEQKLSEENSIQLDKKFISVLEKGQNILLDDGTHELEVIEKSSNTKLKAKVLSGSTLTSRKGAIFPGINLNLPALAEKDIRDTKLASEVDAEFIAMSFVRSKEDILELKKHLKEGRAKPEIIAKIETMEAVKNISEILDVVDAIMVARGDLGIEIYLEAVPVTQKKIIKKTIKRGKPVIVATQMLKSMAENPTPTRAEISDIANASYDLADSVMLSEESAVGKYPVKAVKYMTKTLRHNEMESVYSHDHQTSTITSVTSAIVQSANSLQERLKGTNEEAEAFVALTESGRTAKLLSSTRPELPIFAFTQNESVANKLTLSWGVTSFVSEFDKSINKTLGWLLKGLKERGHLQNGDSVIVISGQNVGVSGQTDSIRVITLEKD